MNPIQSAEGAACAGGMRPVTHASSSPSTKGRSTEPQGKRAGMKGALELSSNFVRQAMMEGGFVDIQATHVQMIEAFTQDGPAAESGPTDTDIDLAAASDLAARMETQTPDDGNQAMQAVADVDPNRVAALLK
jgi:hypothetical protein